MQYKYIDLTFFHGLPRSELGVRRRLVVQKGHAGYLGQESRLNTSAGGRQED